jgi:hypothetical protein
MCGIDRRSAEGKSPANPKHLSKQPHSLRRREQP